LKAQLAEEALGRGRRTRAAGRGELEAETAEEVRDREALSLVVPLGDSLGATADPRRS
jgi:hypothetical protein